MSLNCLFHPEAIAVFGSAAPGKLANILIKRLMEGGAEKVFAVNPKGLGVDSVPGYQSLLAINEKIELALIAAPSVTVKGIMEDCGKKGVKAAIIISSGFSEAGNSEGEKEVMEVARRYGIRCVGPNCAGIINTHSKLVATLETMPPKGNISMISQSGAIGGAFMDLSNKDGVGIAKFLSYGNGADLTVLELLQYLKEDEDTKVIALYMEAITDGRRFMDTVKEVCLKKPVVIVKSGRTGTGQRAAMSHTGSMAGSDAVIDAALKQCGAIRVDTLKELFEVCKGFSLLPPLMGNRLAVITNSGGPGVMSTDRAETVKIEVPVPEERVKEEMKTFLPSFAGLNNPVDLTVEGSGDDYEMALKYMLKEMDCALVIYVGTPYLKSYPIARGIVNASKECKKPITVLLQVGTDTVESVTYLRENGIPCFDQGETAVYVLSYLSRYQEWKRKTTSGSCFDEVKAVGQLFRDKTRLLEPEAMELLHRHGFHVPEFVYVTASNEAEEAAVKLGYPIVMKVVADDIIHKSEFGGVILNIKDSETAKEAYKRLEKVGEGRNFRGVIMYPMQKPGKEIILGLTKDKQFGSIVAFGMGGIYTEVLKDVSLRIAPVNKETAKEMITEIKMLPLLRGVRGEKPINFELLAETISEFSRLPFIYPDMEEADLNPVFLYEEGLKIADVRILGK